MNLAVVIARTSKEDDFLPDIDIDFAVVSDEFLNNMRTMISRTSDDSNLIFLGDHATLPPEVSQAVELSEQFTIRHVLPKSVLPSVNELEGFRPGIVYSYDTTSGRMVDLTSIRLEEHMD